MITQRELTGSPKLESIFCRGCGKEFLPASDEPASVAGFCSDACQAEYHGQALVRGGKPCEK